MAIVDEAMAARTWPGQDPIGRRVKFGGLHSRNEWLTVVGVAATTRYREFRDAAADACTCPPNS